MNQRYNIRRLLVAVLALALPGVMALAANTTKTVTQVTASMDVPAATDYHISSTTPIASGVKVNLLSTSSSVIILDAVKPSRAYDAIIPAYVTIDGAKAVVGTNCDVRIYAEGAIIYPYTEKDTPLKVYSEQNFGGTEVSSFGLESNGGFMVTLTDAKLNNKIRSFKLRRGYMVTFATKAGGYGYSRCFIAADEDMEVATLPGILDKSISSYRVFKWNDNSKKGLANNTDVTTCNLLGVTSCYSFGNGTDTGRDIECVRHHIHEVWPSIASIGENSYTTSNPTVKTNNEPGNSADDQPATVAQVLANWEALMATGKRLCSPSSHDGSLNWLRAFMDSIDARGWRCDVLDMHCYWPEGSFSGLANWYNSYKRPIWISEWVWGASWNKNGCFSTGYTDEQAMSENATVLSRILNNLESWNYIERYFYWNSEADRSKIVLNGSLTAAGKVYAGIESKVGFKSNLVYVPKVPKSKGKPSDVSVKYNISTGEAVITWYDPNGEYNTSMKVEKQLPGSNTWVEVGEVELQENAANYTFTDTNVERDTKYRIHAVYADGSDNYSARTPQAIPDAVSPGSAFTVDGVTYYVGGNVLMNGDFAMGFQGWTSGTGDALSAPEFEVVSKAGYNDKPFLQSYSHEGATKKSSVNTTIDVEPNTNYYFSGTYYFPNGSQFSTLDLSGDGLTDKTAYRMPASDNWAAVGTNFNTGAYTHLTFKFRWLSAQAAYSNLCLQRLFTTQEEALADAKKCEEARAAMEAEYPTFAAKAAEAAEAEAERLNTVGKDLKLEKAIAEYATTVDSTSILYPRFTASSAWKMSGTYEGGTQRTATLDGASCWKAQWTDLTVAGNEDKTMGVTQTLTTALTHGVYLLNVDAAADHYCLSDQHAYFINDGDTAVSSNLSWAVADLDIVEAADKWETLTTTPLYLVDKSKPTVGFVGSKNGATDGLYKPYNVQNGTGDNREGSWYATNFRFTRIPVFQAKSDSAHWCGICPPTKIVATQSLRLFDVVGMSADSTQIYLEEIDSVAAGTPCVALLSDSIQMIIEEGAITTRTKSHTSMRGYLALPNQVAPRNSLVLKDGYWQTQTSSKSAERVRVGAYSAVIKSISDVPVLTTPTSYVMSIDNKVPTAIQTVTTKTGVASEAFFDLNGRRIAKPTQPGVYVRVSGGEAQKIILK